MDSVAPNKCQVEQLLMCLPSLLLFLSSSCRNVGRPCYKQVCYVQSGCRRELELNSSFARTAPFFFATLRLSPNRNHEGKRSEPVQETVGSVFTFGFPFHQPATTTQPLTSCACGHSVSWMLFSRIYAKEHQYWPLLERMTLQHWVYDSVRGCHWLCFRRVMRKRSPHSLRAPLCGPRNA